MGNGPGGEADDLPEDILLACRRQVPAIVDRERAVVAAVVAAWRRPAESRGGAGDVGLDAAPTTVKRDAATRLATAVLFTNEPAVWRTACNEDLPTPTWHPPACRAQTRNACPRAVTRATAPVVARGRTYLVRVARWHACAC